MISVGSEVTVVRTKKTHLVVNTFDSAAEGKSHDYYLLDNGTHYWAFELRAMNGAAS
jgi:hypothetical protein